jgi:hypothetical protein
MAQNTFFTPLQNRTLFAFLALSAGVKLVAAVAFAAAALLAADQNLAYAWLAVLFAVGFSWMARCLQPAIRPLFG